MNSGAVSCVRAQQPLWDRKWHHDCEGHTAGFACFNPFTADCLCFTLLATFSTFQGSVSVCFVNSACRDLNLSYSVHSTEMQLWQRWKHTWPSLWWNTYLLTPHADGKSSEVSSLTKNFWSFTFVAFSNNWRRWRLQKISNWFKKNKKNKTLFTHFFKQKSSSDWVCNNTFSLVAKVKISA